MKKKLKSFYRNQEGVILAEVVISLILLIILINVLYNFISFNFKVNKKLSENQDELVELYKVENYIKNEIKYSDYLIRITPSMNYKGELINNIGFIIVNTSDKYINYVTYALRGDILYRYALNSEYKFVPREVDFSGKNKLSEKVIDISNSRYDQENQVVYLNFELKSKVKESIIYLRGSDYE